MWQSIQTQLVQDYQIRIDPDNKLKIHTNANQQFFSVDSESGTVLLQLLQHPLLHDTDIYYKQLNHLNQYLWQPEFIGSGQLSPHYSYSLFKPLHATQEHPSTEGLFTFLNQLKNMHDRDDSGMFGFDFDFNTPFSLEKNQWQKNWASFFSEQRIGWQLQLHAEAGRNFISIDVLVSLIKAKLLNYQPTPSLIHGGLFQNYWLNFEQKIWFYQPSLSYGDAFLDLAALSLIPTFTGEIRDWIATESSSLRIAELFLIYQLYYVLMLGHHNKEKESEILPLIQQIIAI